MHVNKLDALFGHFTGWESWAYYAAWVFFYTTALIVGVFGVMSWEDTGSGSEIGDVIVGRVSQVVLFIVSLPFGLPIWLMANETPEMSLVTIPVNGVAAGYIARVVRRVRKARADSAKTAASQISEER